MSLENLIMQIKSSQETLLNAKEAATRLLNEIMADENIPLWDRWNTFMEFSFKCLPIASDVVEARESVADWINERYEVNRYQTILYCDRFDEYYMTTHQRNQYPEAIEGTKANFEKLPEEMVTSLIKSGYAGFVNDW